MPMEALAVPRGIVAGILPVGITAKTVTTGPWVTADGTVATGQAMITCPVNLVHTPTGQPIAAGSMKVPLVDGMASWTLCPTDQAGLNRTADWTYTLQVRLYNTSAQPDPLNFQLLEAGPDTVDLDTLVPMQPSTGASIYAQLDATVVSLLNDTTSATYARVIALIDARTGFGAGTP